MATTQLFVELLLIGLGALLWLVATLALLLGATRPPPVSLGGGLGLMVVAGTAYVLGILVDRGARQLFHRLEARNARRVFGPAAQPTPRERELFALHHSKGLGAQLMYNRSRYRICRAWVLNFGLLGIVLPVWVRAAGWASTTGAVLTAALLGALALGTLFAADALSLDFYRNVDETYRHLQGGPPTPEQPAPATRAAGGAS